MTIKSCAICRHIGYSAASPGYSEMTPGGECSWHCNKNHQEIPDAFDYGIDAFAEFIRVAEKCPDFEVVSLEPEPKRAHEWTGVECLAGVVGEPTPGSHPHSQCRKCGYVSWSELESECSGKYKAETVLSRSIDVDLETSQMSNPTALAEPPEAFWKMMDKFPELFGRMEIKPNLTREGS